MLRERGYDDAQIVAIICSKWTRWAADASSTEYGKANESHLAAYLDQMGNDECQMVSELTSSPTRGLAKKRRITRHIETNKKGK